MAALLTAESPRFDAVHAAAHPLRVPLYMHQEADIWQMRRLEDSAVGGAVIPTDVPTRCLRTRAGILADKPGSGKSYTMLAHVIARPVLDGNIETRDSGTYLGGQLDVIEMHKREKVLPTNLFIVPRGTLLQWKSYLHDMTGFPLRNAFCNVKCDVDDMERILAGAYDIVIITDTAFKRLLGYQELAHVTFQRLIIDEADSIDIPSYKQPDSFFTWYVTATPIALLTRAATAGLRRIFNTPWELERIVSGAVTHLIVESAPEFVDEALRLPSVQEVRLEAVRSRIHDVIHSYVPATVMQAIDACDIEAAISKLQCNANANEDSIIFVITSNMKRGVRMLEESLAEAPAHLVSSILAKVRKLNDDIANVTARIKDTDCCPIGLDTIEVKAVTPCCNNAFEFSNLIKALDRRAVCPLCKHGVMPSDILVVHNGPGSSRQVPETGRFANKVDALRHALREIKAKRQRPKVLIFSDFNMGVASGVCTEMGLHAQEVQGTTAHINLLVSKFVAGTGAHVLLLDANHFAAGLNLQAATDIVTMHAMTAEKRAQLLGRAQRPGRTEPLTVYNISFHDESMAV